MPRAIFVLLALHAGFLLADTSPEVQRQVDSAVSLQKQGSPKQAQQELEKLIAPLRTSGNPEDLARVLTAARESALAAGDYPAAVRFAQEALAVHEKLADQARQADDWNAMGRANVYQGKYADAIDAYTRALGIDRARGNRQGEITRLYNIGNVYFEQGRYVDAYHNYQSALDLVNASAGEPWNPRLRQIAVANLAILYQRLGRYQQALDLYLSLQSPVLTLPVSERAQILANLGTLYRRLGDPAKALDTYHQAQGLFSQEHMAFGEIGVLKNIGIVLALDLDRMPEALDAFAAARKLAPGAADAQLVPLSLYIAHAQQLLGRKSDAGTAYASALDGARKLGSKEYQWRALFGLGQLAEGDGRADEALRLYLDAIMQIESVRSGLDLMALKRDFQADKREVYDAALHLVLAQPQPPLEQVFQLMEHGRSRILQDQLPSGATLQRVQQALPPGTVVLEYWTGDDTAAVLSITRDTATLASRSPFDPKPFREALLDASAQTWRDLASHAGHALIGGLPALEQRGLENVIVVPDGSLSMIPFEVLPLRDGLLLDRAAVSYLPAASLVLKPVPRNTWRPPWRTEVLAFANPIAGAVDSSPLASAAQNRERWAPLPRSEDEVRYISAIVPGRSELHIGPNARKAYLLTASSRTIPILHLGTHASADYTDPERSRVLLAPSDGQATPDFLFLREVYGLDLKGVDLVVLSACDTEVGKLVRGEGVEGFGRAFLSAGANSAVTTLWRVGDDSTAEFMKQFYYQLNSGVSKASALRTAKLRFLHSGSALAHPHNWAAFVLSGDGLSTLPHVISWVWLAGGALLILLFASAAYSRIKARSSR